MSYTPLDVFLAASWVITAWEGLVAFDDEVKFIWTCVCCLPSENHMERDSCLALVCHIPPISSGCIFLGNTLRWLCRRKFLFDSSCGVDLTIEV